MRHLLPVLLLLSGCTDHIETGSPPKARMTQPVPSGHLVVESVDLANPKRLCHGVIVFAADAERAQTALEAHRAHKEEIVAKLPQPKAGEEAGLYLIWGHYPEPTLTAKDIKASYDAQLSRVVITLPPWSGEKPDRGIGMDWRNADRSSWTFVGYRVKLAGVPAGERRFEVREVDGDKSRVLAEGSFTLQR